MMPEITIVPATADRFDDAEAAGWVRVSPRTAQAVEYATTNGARVIEAYPYDTAAAKKSVNQLFRAVLSVFEAAGFRETVRPKPDRTIVALEVSGESSARPRRLHRQSAARTYPHVTVRKSKSTIAAWTPAARTSTPAIWTIACGSATLNTRFEQQLERRRDAVVLGGVT
jgi:hypothetical protein